MRVNIGLKIVLVIAVLLLCTSMVWAAGKCPKCGRVWNQPWAKDIKFCPADGTALIPIERKASEDDSEIVRALKIIRINKHFSNYYRRRVALCIGINNYPHFPTLEYAVKDAQSVAAVLMGYGFNEVFLLTDARATKGKILNELLRFKAEAEKEDLFVLYFAGHGTTGKDHKGREKGYLIPVDCKDESMLEEQAISMGLFKDICDTMPNKHILFLVDCCYSGYGLTRSIPRRRKPIEDNISEYLNVATRSRAVQLITAGGKNDLAHEREGHGIFTSYLLNVLEGKTTHKNDGVISALEMASYIKQNVIIKSKGKQNPSFGYLLGNGDVVFITGQQETKTYERKKLLSIDQIEALYHEAGELRKEGEYLEAENKMLLAYTHFRRHHSKDAARTMKYLNRLSNLSLWMYKSDMAAYYSQEIIDLSKDDMDKASGYTYLGLAYDSKGDYDRAIEYFKKALAIDLKKLGPEHPSVAGNYNSLGSAYQRKGDYDRAIEYYQKALAIDLKKLGPEHPNVAIGYNNLGLAYDSKGDYDRAI